MILLCRFVFREVRRPLWSFWTYLDFYTATGNREYQRLYDRVLEVGKPNAFFVIFGDALRLGTLSPRTLFATCQRWEQTSKRATDLCAIARNIATARDYQAEAASAMRCGVEGPALWARTTSTAETCKSIPMRRATRLSRDFRHRASVPRVSDDAPNPRSTTRSWWARTRRAVARRGGGRDAGSDDARCASSPRWSLEPGSESTTCARAPTLTNEPVLTFFSLTFDYPRGTLPQEEEAMMREAIRASEAEATAAARAAARSHARASASSDDLERARATRTDFARRRSSRSNA